MIIRKDVIVTLKASLLNSRVVRSTSGYDKCAASTLNGSPNCAVGGTPSGCFPLSPSVRRSFGRCGY